MLGKYDCDEDEFDRLTTDEKIDYLTKEAKEKLTRLEDSHGATRAMIVAMLIFIGVIMVIFFANLISDSVTRSSDYAHRAAIAAEAVEGRKEFENFAIAAIRDDPPSSLNCLGSELICMSSSTKKPLDAATKAISALPKGDGEKVYQVKIEVHEVK